VGVLGSAVLVGRVHHLFVFVLAFLEYIWNSLAPFLRKMPQEAHNTPHLLILQSVLPAGHAAETDTILDDPFQLPVPVLLHVFVAQIEYRRRHLAGERDTGVVAVESVANLAMMLKVFHPGLHYFRCVWCR